MLLRDLPPAARSTLDTGANGIFTALAHQYDEVHLTIQTWMEGLPEGQVKLYITVLEGQQTLDYAVASLGGSARVIGLQIYVADKLASARALIGDVLREKVRSQSLH